MSVDKGNEPAYILTNDGVRIHFEQKGHGSTLILIHGWSGSSQLFIRNYEYLSKYFHVIRYDLRCHGESSSVQYGLRVSRLAMDLQNLLDSLQLKKVSLLGCSLGCAIIWNYIELFGDSRIESTILVDQSPWQMYASDGSWRYGSNGLFSQSALAAFVTSLLKDEREIHKGTVHACLQRDPTDAEIEFFVNEASKAPAWALAKIMEDHNHNDWRSTLPLIKCPTLVVAGMKSRIFPPEGVTYAANIIPNARLVEFENGGHWLYYEEAEKFNDEVKSFLLEQVRDK